MSSAGLSFSGMASGLDTAQIVSELMRVERIPVQSMQRRQREDQAKVDAYGEVTTKLSGLRDALSGLTQLSDFRAHATADSSDEDAVTATVSGEAKPGSVTFSVTQLARQQQEASATGLASADASVGAGTVTISIGGTDHDIATTAGTSLRDLATSITDLGVGVSASVLQVDDGDHRLVVTSDETGEDAAFTLTSTAASLGSFDTLQVAQDAQVTLGSGAGALTVHRSSNTVTDLVEGVSLDLRSAGGQPVTITTARDLDAAVDAVSGLVTAANELITLARDKSVYVPDGESGPLNGQSAIRDLLFDLEGALSSPVPNLDGATSFASAIGITLGEDGTFSLDEGVLRSAFEEDFEAVAGFFARQAQSDDARVTFTSSTDATLAGDYAVQVTQAATIAAITGSSYATAPSDPEVFRITAADGTTVDVTVSAGATASEAVSTINSALSAAGVATLSATLADPSDPDTSAITLGETRYGSYSFSVASVSGTQNAFGLVGSDTGQDVQGTINGRAATGSGRTLTAASDDPDAKGLSLRIAATTADLTAAGGTLDLGSVAYARGLTGVLDDLLADHEGTDGRLERAKGLVDDRIGDLQDRIDAYERRLVDRETFLRRQFTAMEQAISNIQSQGNFFFAQLGGAG